MKSGQLFKFKAQYGEYYFFTQCLGPSKEAQKTEDSKIKRQRSRGVRLEVREWGVLQGDVRQGFHCSWRKPPICQRTACPPMSYLKNLVGQCNMAPPQSLQLAVWALFGVVSWQLAPITSRTPTRIDWCMWQALCPQLLKLQKATC